MPIYIESKGIGFVENGLARHEYLVYVPEGQELNYDTWKTIGAFPSDPSGLDGAGSGSLLNALLVDEFFGSVISRDAWTTDEFHYQIPDATVADYVAAGFGSDLESARHRELVYEGANESAIWASLSGTANNLDDQYTYKVVDLPGSSNNVVYGPTVNSNSFISSLLRHEAAKGTPIGAFETNLNEPGNQTWLGTTGNDVLDANNPLSVGDGISDLFGGNGADTLIAGTNNSYLVAGKDMVTDTLTGNTGDDILVGYFNQNDLGQSDQMTGGDGDDKFFIIDPETALAGGIPDIQNMTPAEGVFTHAADQEDLAPVIDGGDGHDTLDYSYLHGNVTVDFTDGSIINIEEYQGSSTDDTIYSGLESTIDFGNDLVVYGNDGVDTYNLSKSSGSALFNIYSSYLNGESEIKSISNIQTEQNGIETSTRTHSVESFVLTNQTDYVELRGDSSHLSGLNIDAGTNTNTISVSPIGWAGQSVDTLGVDGDVLSLEGLILDAGVTEVNVTFDDLSTEPIGDGFLTVGTSTVTLTGFENYFGVATNSADAAVNDHVTGSQLNNALFGFNGNDTLIGQGDSDILAGDAGEDILVGGYWDGVSFEEYGEDAARDVLIGGAGTDIFLAGNNDLIVDKSSSDFFGYQNYGSNGDGSVYFNGLELTGGSLIDLGDYPIEDQGIDWWGGIPLLGYRDHANAILYYVIEFVENITIEAEDGSTSQATFESYLVGVVDQNKDAVIEVYNFDFTYNETNPELSYGSFLGIGLSQFSPDEDPDKIVGTDEKERLTGTNAGDSMFGKAGDDTLSGGKGDDILEGGKGGDKLDGGAGIDTADYLTSKSGVWVNLDSGSGSLGDAQGDTYSKIENVSGSGLADRITGDSGDNVIIGRGGNDTYTINTNAGQDTFDGGRGSDTLSFYSNVDYGDITINLTTGINAGAAAGLTLIDVENISGGSGAGVHTLTGNSQRNTLSGGDANDLLFGMAGNDALFGSDGNDNLNGGDGNDALYGGDGVDNLTGGAGNDIFVHELAGGHTAAEGPSYHAGDIIEDFVSGEDQIHISGLSYQEDLDDQITGVPRTNEPFLFIGTDPFTYGEKGTLRYEHVNGDTLVMGDVNGDATADFTITLKGLHTLTTSDFTAASLWAVNSGTDQNDTMLGTAGRNFIDGLLGDDTIYGFEGDDVIYGGGGNDTLYGDAGDDYIDGGNGDDDIYGGSGDDHIIDGFGAGAMDGGDGNDTVDVSHAGASAGGATIDISSGTITWTNGQVESAINFENIVGSQGDDTLIGTSGNNALKGGDGNDRIIGGDGYDWITGGAGADIIELNFGDGHDRMYDFEDGVDIIDLSSTGLSFADLIITDKELQGQDPDFSVEIGYEFSGNGRNAFAISDLELQGITSDQISEADFYFG